MTSLTLRPTWEMSDAELLAEAHQLKQQQDQDAATDPAQLLRHLTPNTYRIRPHLTVISNALADLRQRHDAQTSVHGSRLLIEEPPQTGKTVTAVVGAAFWWLVHHPTHRIVIGSYGDSLATDRGSDIRKLVETYGDRYNLAIARGSNSKHDWRLTTGGGVKSVGVGTGIAGWPAHLAIIDDPHKNRAEADSIIFRERVWRWFSADITSRLAPGAPIILVMTPWHPDDTAARLIAEQGRIEEGGRWQVLRMPAFCDDPDHDPLGRKLNEPLTHPLISTKDTQSLIDHWNGRRSTSTVQDWSSLYMCNPKLAEGALLQRALLRERRCYMTSSPSHPCDQTHIKAAVAVDPSGGGKDTAGIVGGYLGSDKRLYITHDFTGVMPSDQWARRACEMAALIDADHIVVENNFGGDMGRLTIRSAWDVLIREVMEHYQQARDDVGRDRTLSPDDRRAALAELDATVRPYRRMCPRISTVRARKNKRLRADPIAQQWVEDRIRTAAYLPELEEEWCIAAGTEIQTMRGAVSIEKVRAGDVVATRAGWRPVEWAGQTGIRHTLEIETSSGSTLRCTPNHELWVEGKGWTRADKLEKSDRIPACELQSALASRSMATAITSPTMGTTNTLPLVASDQHTGYYTGRFGHCITEQYQLDTSYESWTSLYRTTTSPISEWSPRAQGAKRSFTEEQCSTAIPTVTTRHPDQSTVNGSSTESYGPTRTDQSPTGSTSITKTKTGPTTTYRTCELCQQPNTFNSTKRCQSEPAQRVSKCGHTDVERNGHGANHATSPAPNAEQSSSRQASEPHSARPDAASATVTVTSVKASGRVEPVYDLTVSDQHEFFANGLLVHNCTWQPDLRESPGRIDASVYLAYDLLPIPGAGMGTVRREPTGSLPTSAMSPLGRSSGGVSSLGPLG